MLNIISRDGCAQLGIAGLSQLRRFHLKLCVRFKTFNSFDKTLFKIAACVLLAVIFYWVCLRLPVDWVCLRPWVTTRSKPLQGLQMRELKMLHCETVREELQQVNSLFLAETSGALVFQSNLGQLLATGWQKHMALLTSISWTLISSVFKDLWSSVRFKSQSLTN